MDGGRLLCAHCEHPDVQNAYLDGYTASVEVKSILIFNLFGEIIQAALNFTGILHDNKLESASGLLYPKIGDTMNPPLGCFDFW